MAKDQTINVKLDPSALIPILEIIRDHQAEGLKATEDILAKLRNGESTPEIPQIFIIDSAALPVEYFLRESVLDAVRDEIARDYQNTNQLPSGASLKNEVEARSGETQEIPDKTDDSVERGTGSENPGDGSDNGSETGGGDPDPGGQSSESDSERRSESRKGPRK